jgi:hypothetical protein
MALDDVKHVEAVALINGILDHAPSLPPEIRGGAEAWLAANHPNPSAYMAAMRLLSGQEPQAAGVDRGRELCHAHGAHGPEGDCFVCDTQQERERAEAAEAAIVLALFKRAGGGGQPFNLEQILDAATAFGLSDRERVEQALDRLEDDDQVQADVAGRDRPHWKRVQS